LPRKGKEIVKGTKTGGKKHRDSNEWLTTSPKTDKNLFTKTIQMFQSKKFGALDWVLESANFDKSEMTWVDSFEWSIFFSFFL